LSETSVLEVGASAVASSLDGRRFVVTCPVEGLELETGGYVSLEGRLGQLYSLELVPGSDAHARGDGVLLEEGVGPLDRVPVRRADAAMIERWVESVAPPRSSLDAATLLAEPTVRLPLDAGGFDRHTFFCGQSGSGKTYALGTVLEQLLLNTSLRIVVLDPNSDFMRLTEIREGVDDSLAASYADAVAGVARRSATGPADERLHVRFTDCDVEEQAAVLHLDPIADRDEYGVLVDILERGFESSDSSAADVAARLVAAPEPETKGLGTRLRNLGVHRWSVWSAGDEGSTQDLVQSGGPRLLVVDLGSLETRGEKAIAAESILAALWRRRGEREPVLVVIDEAHNVCPSNPSDPVTALATEHAARIAAEGRKFGLYLLVSTQRPQRVDQLVVSQCDNLVLMRMASTGDLAYVSELLSFAPPALLQRATSFRLGEGLVAGKISSHPALVRFGPRISEEGGADVSATWAEKTAS
jgi:DNA helicase HerA-like ATPase